MPTSEAPTNVDESEPARKAEPGPPETGQPESGLPRPAIEPDQPAPPVLRGSRWVDYDTHELLEMISELEDERRWARLREGVLWAILFHALVILAVAMLPRYIFQPRVIEPNLATQHDRDWTYLDTPIERPKAPAPKPALNPPTVKPPTIDKQTLEALNREAPPPPAPAPQPAPAAPAPVPIPPSNQSQSQVEAPRPAAVPARPNFALNSTNPADQLRDAMRNASRNPGAGGAGNLGPGGLALHPGAGTGGVEVLSDTQGVDFRNWLQRWHRETENTWDPLIPDEVNPPIGKSGMVAIRFKVLPNGRLMDGSLVLEGRSGDTALDRAAWGALTGSNYPPLPRDFHGPYLELRAYFLYNMEVPR
jgi:hypothetical protein